MVELAGTGNVHDPTFVALSSPVDPRLLLADRVERWGDLLLLRAAHEHGPSAEEARADVLVGLNSAVEALRGVRPDSREHLERAVRLLGGIDVAAPGPVAERAQKL